MRSANNTAACSASAPPVSLRSARKKQEVWALCRGVRRPPQEASSVRPLGFSLVLARAVELTYMLIDRDPGIPDGKYCRLRLRRTWTAASPSPRPHQAGPTAGGLSLPAVAGDLPRRWAAAEGPNRGDSCEAGGPVETVAGAERR